MPRLAHRIRMACCLSVVSSMVSLGLGVFLLVRTPEQYTSDRALIIEPVQRNVGGLPPGAKIPVTFTLTNLSARPIKLLGAEGLCMPWWRDYGVEFTDETGFALPVLSRSIDDKGGSVASVSGASFPQLVLPGTSTQLSLSLLVRNGNYSGKFSGEVVLYTDFPASERRSQRISGMVVPLAQR
jgi:hypothetical protein